MTQRTRCTDCSAPIVWVDGPRGTVPLNARPTEAFVVVDSELEDTQYEVATVMTQHRCINPRRVKR